MTSTGNSTISPSAADLLSMDVITRQGYTGHTALGSMGLNHMNGRVQDAITGTFLSPDPHIPEPGNTQSFNRYAYVYNNPLTYVDPSGFEPGGIDCVFLPENFSVLNYGGAVTADNAHLVRGETPNANSPCKFLRIMRSGTSGMIASTVGGAGWGQTIINSTVPGAYYAGQSEIAWRDGRYGYSVALYGAALADAFVGVATFGQASLVTSAARAGSTVARAAPTLKMDVDRLAQYGSRVARESGGFFNVVTHAEENLAAVIRNGDWLYFSHRVLARFIQGAAGYTGQPVRLIACKAGACATGLAQNLANKLGVPVLAPTADAFVSETGTFWTSGQWRLFTPGL